MILISIGYLLLFNYGVIFSNIEKNKIKILSYICIFILSIKLILSGSLDLQNYKYPPRDYYLYYAILMFNIIFHIKDYISVNFLKKIKIVEFVGKSTMWIYLWHIPFVIFLLLVKERGIKINFILAYLFVYIGTVIITLIQNKISKLAKEVLLG